MDSINGRRAIPLAAVAVLALSGVATGGQSPGGGIFKAVETEVITQAIRSADPVNRVVDDGIRLAVAPFTPPPKLRRWVSIDVADLRATTLELNLFEGELFYGEVSSTETLDGFELSGLLTDPEAGLDDEAGTVVFVVRGTSVTGTVRTMEWTYRIRPVSGDMHTITRVDPSRLPPLGIPIPTCGVGAERKPCDEDPRR